MGDVDSATDTDSRTHRVYCANCLNCKLVIHESTDEDGYVLRVRCAAGKWRKKVGDEKYYKYFTLMRRSVEECDAYVSMGDARDYIVDLKRSLPTKDEVFQME